MHEQLQVVVQVDGVLVAVLDVLLQCLEHDPFELFRNARIERRGRDDLDVADLLECRKISFTDEQTFAGEHFVKHDAEREDVAAPVDGQAAHLLGRHVAELALENAGLGLGRFARCLGNSEVDQLHFALVPDEHVLRGHIPVHEVEVAALGVALVVRVIQALAKLHDEVADLLHGHGLPALAKVIEDAAQVAPVDVFERDEKAVVDFAEVENLGDVRVLQLHGDLRLVDEHRDELFVLRDARQNALERNNPLEPLNADGLGLEDLGHAPDIDAFEEVVLAEGDWFVQASSVRVQSTARAFPLSASKGPQVKPAWVLVMINRGPTIQTRHTRKSPAGPAGDSTSNFYLLYPNSRHLVPFADFIYHFDSRNHLAENRVLAVEVRLRTVANEKLRATRIGRRRLRHGERPAEVLLTLPRKLVLDGETRAARAATEGAAALNHEVVDHAMKRQAVIIRPLYLFPGLGIRPFLGSLGQAHEISDGSGRVVLEELEHDFARGSLDVCFFHGPTLPGKRSIRKAS